MSTNTGNLCKGKADTTWQALERETCPSALSLWLLEEHTPWSTLRFLGIPSHQVTRTGAVPGSSVPARPWDKPCLGGRMGYWGAAGLTWERKALTNGDSKLQRSKVGHTGLKNGID